MKLLSVLSIPVVAALLFLSPAPAVAAGPVAVYPAQIEGPQGIDTGRVVLQGNRMLFVDDRNPDDSFSIQRSDITGVDTRGDAVTLTIGQPFRSPLMAGPNMVLHFTGPNGAGEVTSWIGPGAPGASARGEANRMQTETPPIPMHEFNVRHNDDNGRLVVGPYDVHFESFNHPDHSRTWTYRDIKSFKRDSDDHEVKIEPDHGDTYKFKIEGGRAMTDRIYNLIGDRLVAARGR